MLRLAILSLLIAGCSELPRDPEETLHHIKERGTLRIGLIFGTPTRPPIQSFLQRLSEATGARPDLETGSSERLLTRLERGEIDLVFGEVASDTPWARRATFIPALDPSLGDEMVVAAAARNGENRWIMLVDRQSGPLQSAR